MHCKTAQLEIATLDARSVELENHLSQCADCRDFAQFASHTVDDLATWRDEPVPAHMMQRIRERTKTAPQRKTNWIQFGVAAAMVAILALPVATVIGNSKQQSSQVRQTEGAAPLHYVRYEYERTPAGEWVRKRVSETWSSGHSIRTLNVQDKVETLHVMDGVKDIEFRRVGNGPVERIERSPTTPSELGSVAFPNDPKAIAEMLIPTVGDKKPEISYQTTSNANPLARDAQCTTAVDEASTTRLNIYRTAKGELVRIDGWTQAKGEWVSTYLYEFDANFDAKTMLDPVLFGSR